MANKFLLIDDDIDDSELFKEALLKVDPACICDRFAHGKIALSELSAHKIIRPDIIFLDINLPLMSGWEILVELKKLDDLKQIPVIMYSTSSSARDKDTARDLGAMCFFTKPHNYKILLKMMEIVVDKMNNDAVSQICAAVKNISN